ncbi:DMT family transporter [Aquabacterium sp. A7-Y]|uniref:DMT family transporter n=1 Tax=Aquabacterium sp. A7-Y TaxID=1349605 RepID=UPI00223E222F|nr:DMT family transporter [Aquabacterium sp. A7-Y]MCW7537254.1 DMT family transporter [Aquabacterium sp. A7-Y]
MSAVLPASPTPGTSSLWSLYARLLCVPVIWGGTFIAGRVIALQVPPATGSVLRYLVACVALLLAAWWLEGGLPRLSRRQLFVTFALGASGIFAYNLFFLGALARLPASRTSLIIALNPAVTIALASLLLHERLNARRWFGVVLALAGVWIVISRGDLTAALGQAVGLGEVLMFGGVCSWAAYTLIGRVALKGLTPLAATTCASLWGCALLAGVAAFELPGLEPAMFNAEVGLAALYLGVCGTALAFVWYSQGVQRIGAARTVVFNNLVPVSGAALGFLLLGEPLLPSMLVGGAVAVTGVMLASRP